MIVPFAAGGPTDIIARIVGEHLSKTLGQQFVVENVAGAGGTTGITRGAQAKPDGYTIMMGHMGTHGAAPALYPNLKYDPTKDFAPIGLAAGTPILIVAKKDFPAKDLKEFVAYVKANGDKVNEAHAGVGSVSHTTCTLLDLAARRQDRPRRLSRHRPALNDLVGGQVDFMCDQIVNLVTQIKAGNIKAYAIATPERSPALPDVPTTERSRPARNTRCRPGTRCSRPRARPRSIVDKLDRRARQGARRRRRSKRVCSNSARSFPTRPAARRLRCKSSSRARLHAGCRY